MLNFDVLLQDKDTQVVDIARSVRKIYFDLNPDLVETVRKNRNSAGYGSGEKMKEKYWYIQVFTNHVNIWFYQWVELDDPTWLLEWTGKIMRHVKVVDIAQLKDTALIELLLASILDV